MMKKEEFITKLRKNLSVLEEREIQDIVEEYEQHIDMKIREGLSEEEAIKDFGDLKELTAGILEAYHVKADYNEEKKNIDFDKMKEESKKATEKATNAIGKGAGALGRGVETAGKWTIRQMRKLWSFIKKPFAYLKAKLHAGSVSTPEKGFWGKMWMMILEFCSFIWRCIIWCVRLFWNLFWLVMGVFAGVSTLSCIFLFGLFSVFLVMGYPVAGVTMITVGGGIISGAVTLFCFSLLKRKCNQRDENDVKKDFDSKDSDTEEPEEEESSWEYPEGHEAQAKRITVSSYQEVLNHA